MCMQITGSIWDSHHTELYKPPRHTRTGKEAPVSLQTVTYSVIKPGVLHSKTVSHSMPFFICSELLQHVATIAKYPVIFSCFVSSPSRQFIFCEDYCTRICPSPLYVIRYLITQTLPSLREDLICILKVIFSLYVYKLPVRRAQQYSSCFNGPIYLTFVE